MAIEVPDGDEMTPVQRPGVRHLLWYVVGGSLPEANWTWVLHDVTCGTWWLRHFARTAAIIVPLFVLYMALVPASLGLRLLSGLTFSAGIFLFSLVNILVDTDRRAVRAGYGPGYASEVRGLRAVERQRSSNYERRERAAERRSRRNARSRTR